jgi:hypothetical protein
MKNLALQEKVTTFNFYSYIYSKLQLGGIPMDASKESLVGCMPGGMTGGMMDEMMQRDPCEILNRLIMSEQMEIPIYNQLAQTAPSACLRQMFAHFCAEDTMKVQKLCALAGEFGCGPMGPGMGAGPGFMADPPGGPPLFYSQGEQTEKKEP